MKGFLQATRKSLLEGIASVFFFARLLHPCTGNGLASSAVQLSIRAGPALTPYIQRDGT
jgi:hypothetical protein